ncbi:hypothetical protein EXIGLDRAFT_333323 [Exidia glandulosa HHB12029]|uniref:F-box domain-containing protein n=1 Tax=Exidia glandulosa HHB12029 TaxID=1314781 RepID=A0A165LMQ8_EXIGL|nr:hypothetical protein EXIGLDRAFT_333323 [Exidia glandulosa HHB12029]
MTLTPTSTRFEMPAEIALFILEHAARDHVFTDRSWVASLCLVCRAAQTTVTPILYRVLDLTTNTSPLLDPRSLDLGLFDTHTRILIARRAYNVLLPPLRNIDVLVCTFEQYWPLFYYNSRPPPPPAAVLLTTDFSGAHPTTLSIVGIFAQVTHLALPFSLAMTFMTVHLPSLPRISHVFVEMVPWRGGMVLAEALVDIVRVFLANAKGLRRIVCRMATIPDVVGRKGVRDGLMSLQDERVALNDAATEHASVADLFAEDALGGSSLWESGIPVYRRNK